MNPTRSSNMQIKQGKREWQGEQKGLVDGSKLFWVINKWQKCFKRADFRVSLFLGVEKDWVDKEFLQVGKFLDTSNFFFTGGVG